MLKTLYTLLLGSLSVAAYAQNTEAPVKEFYNLDCEKVLPGQNYPGRWNGFLQSTKNYITRADTAERHSGKYALFITPKPGKADVDSGFIAFPLPPKFVAKQMTVKGWLKLQDVKKHAGIMIRFNALNGDAILQGDLSEQKINGTRGWQQYSITLPIPDNVAQILIGPVLAGTGKLWADDFDILFDGIDVRDAPLKSGYKVYTPKLPDYGNIEKAGGYVKLKDADLYYETYGKGEPLLLLHGNSQSIKDFKHQIPELSKKFKVIAVDTRGQGKSTDRSTAPLTYDLFAQDMKELMDVLQIKKAHVLGWSDGGNTGLIMAIKYPEYINKLAVTGAILYPSESTLDSKVLVEIKQVLEQLKGATDNASINKRRLFTLMLDEPHIKTEDLKNIKAPTLVMAGDKDMIKEEHTRAIASNIPQGKLHIFPNASHYVPTEKVWEFNNTVMEFLR